jgi:fluoroacetyl-CoA thioesterase
MKRPGGVKNRRRQPPRKRVARPSRRSAASASSAAASHEVPPSPSSTQFTAPSQHPRMGLEATVEMDVPHEWTIQSYDSKLPPVLSTPAMIGMMELAAARAVQPELSSGAITVGTRIEVDHLKAVTLGSTVRAHARLVGHEGRFLVFEVEARSGQRVIGRGRVFRAVVEPAKFAKAATKRPA